MSLDPKLLEAAMHMEQDYIRLQRAAKNVYTRFLKTHADGEGSQANCLDCHLMEELRQALIGSVETT